MGDLSSYPDSRHCTDDVIEYYDDGCRPFLCRPELYPCNIYDDYFNAASGGAITTNPYSLCTQYGDAYVCVLPCSAYDSTWCVEDFYGEFYSHTGSQTYSCLGDGTCGVKHCDDVCAGGYDCNSVDQCAYNCEDDALNLGDCSGLPNNYFCQTNTSTCEPDPCTMKSDCRDGFTCLDDECVESCIRTECGHMDSNPTIAKQWDCNTTTGFCYFNPSLVRKFALHINI